MNDINSIEIIIEENGVTYDLNIIPRDLKVYISNLEKKIEISMIEKILDIICKWDYEYVDDSKIDVPVCTIKVNTKEGTDKYLLKGVFPNGYRELRDMVAEIYG